MLGKMASIMMSSTETIFYTMSVYFMAAGIKKPLHAGGRADRNHCGNRRKHYPGGIYVSSRRLWLRPEGFFCKNVCENRKMKNRFYRMSALHIMIE